MSSEGKLKLHTEVKPFDQLSIYELHDLLKLRSDVFVVEQDCVYPDIDGKDQCALHVIGTVAEKIVAYTRCFPPGYYFKHAAIGRVVVDESYRKYGFGYDIMNASIKAVEQHYKTSNIKVSAQTYLLKFYKNLGFTPVGEEYLEDGIPHTAMTRT